MLSNRIVNLGMFVACLFLLSCARRTFFSLKTPTGKQIVGSSIKISLENPDNRPIDSVVYYFQGNKIATGDTHIDLSLAAARLGNYPIKAVIYSGGKAETHTQNISIYADAPPKIYTYEIINEYKHDKDAYTQGLEFHNGILYESVGQYGSSGLRKTDYKTGAILDSVRLDKAYFGEGITIMNDRIYMLTWREKVGFIYDLNFKKEAVFAFNKSKEGWGLCNDGSKIYKSDGSDKIWILDPKTLTEKDYFQICSDESVFSKANELEWVDGKIYANTYLKDGIMIINASNGALLGVVDCRGLKERVTQSKDIDVLNGIAYNPQTGTFFITGKNWDKLFEVRILEKK